MSRWYKIGPGFAILMSCVPTIIELGTGETTWTCSFIKLFEYAV